MQWRSSPRHHGAPSPCLDNIWSHYLLPAILMSGTVDYNILVCLICTSTADFKTWLTFHPSEISVFLWSRLFRDLMNHWAHCFILLMSPKCRPLIQPGLLLSLLLFLSLFVGLVVSMPDYWSRGRGFDPRHFHNFKCGLGLERGPPSHVRTIG